MQIKAICILVLILFSGCIDKFNPEVNSGTGSVVIEGHITNDGKTQVVRVSQSTNLDISVFSPISGCKVSVSDNLGNTYIYEEQANGTYTYWFNPSDIRSYLYFKLKVTLPNGSVYISEEEQMLKCPQVDRIYYSQEDPVTIDPSEDFTGIQIFADYNGGATETEYIKFDIEETWKYAAPFVVEGVYDTSGFHLGPSELATFHYCWKSEKVEESFFLSTHGLTDNIVTQFPLHFVSNETNRLQYNYSILVKQQSISASAYHFYSELKNNVSGAKGLYEKLPSSIRGNIYLEGDKTQTALGYFHVSDCAYKRIFIKNKFSFRTHRYDLCHLKPILSFGDIPEKAYPIYIQSLETPVDGANLGWTSKFCFDCMLNGGSTVKPDFWNE